MKRQRLCLVTLGFLATALDGCSSSASDDTPGEDRQAESSSREDSLSVLCLYPHRYFGVSETQGCSDVATRHGRWVAESVFSQLQAPAQLRNFACYYSWKGGLVVDRDELKSRYADPQNELTPDCGQGRTPPRAEDAKWHPGPLVGAAGCDVCGLVFGNKIGVVFPPDREWTRATTLHLSNGSTTEFVVPNDVNAGVLDLPAPPTGATYVPGPVTVR